MNKIAINFALMSLIGVALPTYAQEEVNTLTIQVTSMNIASADLKFYAVEDEGEMVEEDSIPITQGDKQYDRQTENDYVLEVKYGFETPWLCKEEGSDEAAFVNSETKKVTLNIIYDEQEPENSTCLLSANDTLGVHTYINGLEEHETAALELHDYDDDGKTSIRYEDMKNGFSPINYALRSYSKYVQIDIIVSAEDYTTTYPCKFSDNNAKIENYGQPVYLKYDQKLKSCSLSYEPVKAVTFTVDLSGFKVSSNFGTQPKFGYIQWSEDHKPIFAGGAMYQCDSDKETCTCPNGESSCEKSIPMLEGAAYISMLWYRHHSTIDEDDIGVCLWPSTQDRFIPVEAVNENFVVRGYDDGYDTGCSVSE